jgi:hypothetical protein
VNDLLKYAKELTCKEAKLLGEAAVEERLNIDNDPSVDLELTYGEIVDIVMRPDRGSNTDDDIIMKRKKFQLINASA